METCGGDAEESRYPLSRQTGASIPASIQWRDEATRGNRYVLVLDPDLIIADEPTTALDVTIQAQVLDLLRRLRDETNAAIVLITHDLGVVAELCDRVAVMYAGKIVEEGSVEDLFDRPKHPYTQGLLKSVPRPGVGNGCSRLKDSRLTCMIYRKAAASPSGVHSSWNSACIRNRR